MDELREVILSCLSELHSTGLSASRYELYLDAVYRCETVDELLELAALELQMESHEFLNQLKERKLDEDLEQEGMEGFGDDGAFDGMSPEKPREALSEEEEKMLELQQALLKVSTPENDPNYFDIDALFAGGIPPKTTTEDTPAYKDALAELLAAYPMDGDEDEEQDFEPIPSDTSDSGMLSGFSYSQPSLGAPQPFGFTQNQMKGFPQDPVEGFPKIQHGFPQSQQVRSGFNQKPPVKQTQGNLSSVLADFSHRKK